MIEKKIFLLLGKINKQCFASFSHDISNVSSIKIKRIEKKKKYFPSSVYFSSFPSFLCSHDALLDFLPQMIYDVSFRQNFPRKREKERKKIFLPFSSIVREKKKPIACVHKHTTRKILWRMEKKKYFSF